MIPVTLSRTKAERSQRTFQCVTCFGLFRVRFGDKGGKRSCVECEQLREKAKQAAQKKLQAEYRAGRMLRATAYKCVDCGKPASMYDHRDYTKPLVVEPVCRSCNWHRGPAAL